MKTNKKIMTGMLALAMMATMFTGCGSKKKTANISHGNLADSSVVMTVGTEGITFQEIKGYCYFLKGQYEGNFGSAIWDYSLDGKKTIGDEAKEEVVSMITQIKVITQTADKQKVTLTADEKDQALQNAENLVENASKKDIQKYALNVQEMSQIYQDNILANKMFYIATDAADTTVSDEEAKQISVEVLQVMTKGTNKNGAKIAMNATDKKLALQKITKIKNKAKTSNFTDLATSNSDAQKVNYTVGKDTKQLEQSVVTAAFSLAKGEISDVITGDQGYYLVYCTDDNNEDATYKKKEQIIEQRQTTMFKDKYADWLKDRKVNIGETFWNQFSI